MRKIIACLLALMLLAVTVSAQAPFVEDTSGLLSQAEAENLEAQFSQLYAEYGFTVSVVTMPSLGGEIAAQAAKDAYASNGYGNDGMMLFICPDEGEWYIYTSGLCSQVVQDTMLEEIRQSVTMQLQEGNYYQAIESFCQTAAKPVIAVCNDRLAQAEQSRSQNGKLLVLGLVCGLTVGVAVAMVLRKLSQKPARPQKELEEEAVPVPDVPTHVREVPIPVPLDETDL